MCMPGLYKVGGHMLPVQFYRLIWPFHSERAPKSESYIKWPLALILKPYGRCSSSSSAICLVQLAARGRRGKGHQPVFRADGLLRGAWFPFHHDRVSTSVALRFSTRPAVSLVSPPLVIYSILGTGCFSKSRTLLTWNL